MPAARRITAPAVAQTNPMAMRPINFFMAVDLTTPRHHVKRSVHYTPAVRPSRLFLVVYGLSGAAALLYEVIWLRLLTLSMGHTAVAVGTVLAAFMGGLA